MNILEKQRRLKALFKRMALDGEHIESIPVSPKRFEAMESVGRGTGGTADARATLRDLDSDRPLDESQFHALEAIILPGLRPVVDIADNAYLKPDEPFEHFDKKEIREKIQPAIRAIGRVELVNHPAPFGGTAFVVGDGIMMTNRHVAEIFASGLGQDGLSFKPGIGAGIDLKREIKTEDEGEEPTILKVEKVLMIHPFWDMALLEVRNLSNVTPLVLSSVDPADLSNQDVAVIGYPAFDPRNNGPLQHDIFRSRFNVKRMQPGKIQERRDVFSYGNSVNAVTHDSSTLGGNSGSAVVDASTGHVVALHFAGIYLDANFAVPTMELARDARIVELGIFRNVGMPPRAPWDHLWDRADPKTIEAGGGGNSGRNVCSGRAMSPGSRATWSIPINVTIQVGGEDGHMSQADAGGGMDSSGLSADRSPSPVDDSAVEKVVEPFHDQNYAKRPGYDAEFLGIKVPLPKITDKQVVSKFGDNDFVLKYFHFSLVMHKNRRLAIYTASNVDGRPNKRKPDPTKKYTRKALARMGKNDREKWFNDPRIPADHQLHNVFYDEDRQSFDKGHLVRRDDVTWGNSYSKVEKANGDTFHVTNCTPQVLHFNRSNKEGIWGKLENEILKQAKKDNDKYILFSGPILADDDPVFHGEDDDFLIEIQIPVRFWKIVIVRDGNELQSYGFILKQNLKDVKFTEGTFEEFTELVFDEKWDEHRMSIADLEDEIELVKFPNALHESDMPIGNG